MPFTLHDSWQEMLILSAFFCAANEIGDDGAQALGESLEHNNTLLQLSLKGIALDTELLKNGIKKLLLTTDVHIFLLVQETKSVLKERKLWQRL